MNTIEKILIISIITGIIALILWISAIPTIIEMNTFNKLSHTKVTFIEALFTNLRVTPD